MFYVAWSNPDSTGSVQRDGIYATINCTLTAGAVAASTQPTLVCDWVTQDSTVKFDIHPVAAYDSGSSVLDTTDDVTATATTQICTELWKLTDTSIACVEMQGTVKRKFSTGDTTDDFILDYVDY